jgi:hypothetical protein
MEHVDEESDDEDRKDATTLHAGRMPLRSGPCRLDLHLARVDSIYI